MTANTSNDDPSAGSTAGSSAGSSAGIEIPVAGLPPPAAIVDAPAEPDLQSRIGKRRTEMIAKLGALRGDVRAESVESRDKLKAKLSELAHIVKWGVVGGWASLGAPLTDKLEQWLAESERQLNTKHERP